MDRRLILSVAGSGKTSYLINKLDKERRFLIVTYTNNNTEHIKHRIIQRYGCIPKNITVYTYYEFLMAVCYRPYLSDRVKAKGIDWEMPNPDTLRIKRNRPEFYLNSGRYLYHNRIALLCKPFVDKISKRIEKYYDCFYFDEIQDLDGHDFNLLLRIVNCHVEILLVGDFYQHTFSTSQDGNTNGTLYDDYEKYKNRWAETDLIIDTTTLSKSHRCSHTITEFVRNSVGIDIDSHSTEESHIVFLTDVSEINQVLSDDKIPKLFLSNASKYHCHSINWGDSKGLDDFDDVCIVLNQKTLKLYNTGELHKSAPLTKKKFYVACTRARRNIYFVPQAILSAFCIT